MLFKGGNMAGVIIVGTLIIIVILEICRYFRLLKKSLEDINELKEKVTNIEELLKKQSK